MFFFVASDGIRFWCGAVESQMSHQGLNSSRAAYIHKAEFLEERRLMLQWWVDFLDANMNRAVSSFDFGKHF